MSRNYIVRSSFRTYAPMSASEAGRKVAELSKRGVYATVDRVDAGTSSAVQTAQTVARAASGSADALGTLLGWGIKALVR